MRLSIIGSLPINIYCGQRSARISLKTASATRPFRISIVYVNYTWKYADDFAKTNQYTNFVQCAAHVSNCKHEYKFQIMISTYTCVSTCTFSPLKPHVQLTLRPILIRMHLCGTYPLNYYYIVFRPN